VFWLGLNWQSIALTLTICFVPSMPALAFWAPPQGRLENFDRRQLVVPTPEQADAATRVKKVVTGARVEFDSILASPRIVASPNGFLTGPSGGGRAIMKQTMDALPANDPDRVVKAFLNEHAALFGHNAEVLSQARRKEDFITPHNGLRTVVWEQQHNGIPVFEGVMIAHTTKRGELVNVSSQLVPDLHKLAEVGMPRRLAIQSNLLIHAEEAIVRAAANVEEQVDPADVIKGKDGAKQHVSYKVVALPGDTRVRQVWLPVSRNLLRLCWEVQLTSRKRGEMFVLLVDTETGEVLVRQGLTEYYSNATYQVYTSDSPSPFSPAWPTLNYSQPAEVSRSSVTLPALSEDASPLGWIADGDNTTLGNNVDAHLDKDADDIPDVGSRPAGAPFRVFDFPLDLSQEPVTYTNAAVVQLFYWCNWMHDKLYQLGFTEAARNFQTSNFSRGGLENDAVQADAQDGSGFNNANMSVPADGLPPRMQMYLWSYPIPNRDGDLDAQIILHEYSHGLSNRRVGSGLQLTALQSRGMGEGWSDFLALSLLSESGDDVNGTYPIGGYADYLGDSLTANYYFGTRRYPYSTDLSKCPLTFKDIAPDQASPHTGIPRNPLVANTANQIHNMGEVWCAALWDARANLINKHGFASGNQLILQLVVDGMTLSPNNPTFLEARDAILQADQVLTDGNNFKELWDAFAKRGMGVSAYASASGTLIGLLEAYDIPDALRVITVGDFVSDGPLGGPFMPLCTNYIITNIGTNTLNWAVFNSQSWISITPSNGILAPNASNTISVCLNSAADPLPVALHTDTLIFSNTTSGATHQRGIQLWIRGGALLPFVDSFESGALQPYWTSTGTGYHRSQVTSSNGPHAGSYHLTMDSWSADGPGRNEVTLTVDLARYTNIVFTCWARGFSNEPDGPPPNPFIGGADFDGIAISQDGNTWYEVQELRTLSSTWTQLVVNLDSAIDIHGLAFNSTFRVRLNRFGNWIIPGDGIGIDDISITGVRIDRLTVQMPATITEGAGVLTNWGNVFLSHTPTNSVVITLLSSKPLKAAVPSSVTVPAGQTNAFFNLIIGEDALLDGSRPAEITASAPAWADGVTVLTVNDNETAILGVKLPDVAIEGTSLTGQVTVSAAPATDVLVSLNSSDTSELTVPVTVVVVAGQTNTDFIATVLNDAVIDGAQTLTVTAHIENWIDGLVLVTVSDNLNVSVEIPADMREGEGVLTNAGRVSIYSLLPAPLAVSLASSDTTELIVPASVIIPAGQTNAMFDLTVVDDTEQDGTQSIQITTSAAGATGGFTTANVHDNDLHHFTWSAITGLKTAAVPFSVTITARNADNNILTNYPGPASLSGAGSQGAVVMLPTSTGGFSNGVWNGELRVNTLDTDITLMAVDGAGQSGTSTPFNVVADAPHHFVFGNIAPTQYLGKPFPVVIIAQDAASNTVTTFSGPATLGAEMMGSTAQVCGVVLGANGNGQAFGTVVAGESYRYQASGCIRFTGRATAYSSDPTGTNYFSGCTNFKAAPTLASTNSICPGLTALSLVGKVGGVCIQLGAKGSFIAPGSGTLLLYYNDQVFGDNAASFSVCVMPDPSLSLTPTNLSSFTSGIWSGNVTVLEAATNVALYVNHASGHTGTGNLFTVSSATDLSLTMTGAPPTVVVGDPLVYSLTLPNNGLALASGVTVTGRLPAHASFVSASVSQGSYLYSNGFVVVSLGDLTNGMTATIQITVTPSMSGILCATGSVASATTDYNPSNDLAHTCTIVPVDADTDAMPDTWEVANGLNPHVTNDADQDRDGDGLRNLHEYLAGTDPLAAHSLLGIKEVKRDANDWIITFASVTGKTYAVEFKNDLAEPPWTALTNLTATGSVTSVADPHGAAQSMRFYRIRLIP